MSNMEDEVQLNDPSEACANDCEDKLMTDIKRMSAGNVAKGEGDPATMSTVGDRQEGNSVLLPVNLNHPRTRHTKRHTTRND